MLFLAFSRSELRYSCDISSSSELSSPSSSEPDSEDECSDEDGPEDEDDAEGKGEVSLRPTECEGSNLPFPFPWAESVILKDVYPDCTVFVLRMGHANRLPTGGGYGPRIAVRRPFRSVPVTVMVPYSTP